MDQESYTVLIVDDEPHVIHVVKFKLEESGLDVAIANNGRVAFDLACKIKPDLIVTDVIMPGLSGVELVEALRERTPGLCAIYMSGYTENAIVHRGELDADVVLLEKPFTSSLTIRRPSVRIQSPGLPYFQWLPMSNCMPTQGEFSSSTYLANFSAV